jgi:hypothetical protein
MPALTPAMGRPDGQTLDFITNNDMPSFIRHEDETSREWGRGSDVYGSRWLHSDIKNMAYFYVHELFQTLSSFVKEDEQ